MSTCLLGLGSNQGAREENIQRALAMLESQSTHVEATSQLYESWPAGGPRGQEPFLNAVALVRTNMPPHQLLEAAREIESQLGRVPSERWGPRPIDIDILLWDTLVLYSSELTIPHPRMVCRRFVLEPAAQVAPQFVHPTLGWSIAQLLDHLNNTPPYMAVVFPDSVDAEKVLAALAEATKLDVRPVLDQAASGETLLAATGAGQLATQLRKLKQRAGLLQKSIAEQEGQNCVWVSNFWFAEPLCHFGHQSGQRQREQLDETIRMLARRLPKPRVVVLVRTAEQSGADSALSSQTPLSSAAEQEDVGPWQLLQQSPLLPREILSPIVEVKASDPSDLVSQLVGIVEGMQ